MSNTVEQIKERLSITEVISGYLELQKAGGRFRARCPFHNERTPSFYVSPDRDSFYCFGCNKGGDVFTFVQEIEGIDFKDALKVLAERAGVEIVYERGGQKEDTSRRERLMALMAHAVFFYHKTLSENPNVVAYLAKRGIVKDTIKNFTLGYAPAEWRALTDYLLSKDFTESDIVDAGLAIQQEGSSRVYDRYRNRVMFPISDAHGKAIAFSGRIYDELPDADLSQGKYINNPETLLFTKSKALFAFDKAKQAIRAKGAVVIVEGQMDVVLSHQSGVTHVVAASGTALTEEHVRQVSRLTDTVIFAFDGDDAGIKATERSVGIAMKQGLTVRIALLPRGIDPADLVLQDKEEWVAGVDNALHVIDFLMKVLLNGVTDARAKRLLAKERILPYIAQLTSSIEQAHFVGQLATELALAEEPIWQDLRSLRGHESKETRAEEVKKQTTSRKHSIIRHIVGLRFLLDSKEYDARLSELLGGDEWNALLEEYERKKDALMFEQEQRYDSALYATEIERLLGELELEHIEAQFIEITNLLRSAESKDDLEATQKHLHTLQEILKKREELKHKRSA